MRSNRLRQTSLIHRLPALLLLPVLVSCSGERGDSAKAPPDLILTGGKVFTADDLQPWADAIAIRDTRIVAIGGDDDITKLAGPETRSIELAGHLVVPGINDAHRHFQATSPADHQLTLTPLEPSWDETRVAIEDAVAKTPAGTWIQGTVGVGIVTDPEIDRTTLDALAPENPVRLSAFYGHGDIYNSLALERLGVADDEPDPLGGFFERETGSQRVNGRVFEYPQWNLARKAVERIDDDDLIERMRADGAAMVALGITSMQNMAMMSYSRYVDLVSRADLPIRVRAIRFPGTNVTSRAVPEEVSTERDRPGARVEMSGIKWILDGTPLERGSAMRQPYLDAPGWRGRLNFPREEIAAILREASVSDEQLLVHAVGDRTIEVLLDEMEALSEVDWPARRVRIEHGDGLAPDLIERARRLGVVVVQNPTHFALPVIGGERIGTDRDFQPLRSLIDSGIPLALGSDGPPNPWLDVMLAVVHPADPSEAITVEQAVIAYTRGAAFAERKEADKGTLSVGKLADLAVLSQDVFEVPPDAIPTTRSLLTLVGGEIVHDAGSLD